MSDLKSYKPMTSGIPSKEELDLFRQWFDIAKSFNPQYLESKDYVLAKKIYTVLDMRWPDFYEDDLRKLKRVGR